jgi:hypothetical protein
MQEYRNLESIPDLNSGTIAGGRGLVLANFIAENHSTPNLPQEHKNASNSEG